MPTTRVLILGGGFGGVYTALHLEKTLARDPDVEVTLVSEENFLLFTPLLHEVAASSLNPSDIVNPMRRMFSRVRFLEGMVRRIDLAARRVQVAYAAGGRTRDLEYDRLVIALGSEDNFFGSAELEENSLTMKSLTDAMLLRNRIVALLENAVIETDASRRHRMLTTVVAGGGFAGVETVGAVHDFICGALRWYPTLDPKEVRVVLVHPQAVVLPELGEALGRYAQERLRDHGVDVLLETKVTGFAAGTVRLDKGTPIEAATLVWSAGVSPSRLIGELPGEKEKQRLKVNACLELPGHEGVWAVGDCASATDENTGKPFPATAQHAVRQGETVAKNIIASLRGRPPRPFRYKMMGQLAAIGHRRGVAQIFGFRFSGLIAWWLWRTVYLLKLPRLEKKIQVAMHWTADLFFAEDITQFVTVRSVEKFNRALKSGRSALAAENDSAPEPASGRDGSDAGLPHVDSGRNAPAPVHR